MTKKILLIEDEDMLLEMYRLRFAADGYTVFGASRGLAGIELAKKEMPDLIFLDLRMPEMDGYEVLKRLKADPQTKKLRVIVLSNLGQDEEISRALDLGAEEYIIKASLTPTVLVQKANEKLADKPASES